MFKGKFLGQSIQLFRVLTFATAFVSALAFVAKVFAQLDQNDFMYAVAPALWRSHTLYRDLMFVQAPGSVTVYGLLFDIVDPFQFHLALRIFSLSALLLAIFFLYRTARILGGSLPALLALVVIFTSYFVATVGAEIGNTSLALLFLTAALLLYVSKAPTLPSCGTIGLFIGLAAASKLNFALYAIPFGLFIGARCGFVSKQLAIYVAGGLIVSGTIWYYAILDFDRFWFFNIEFHHLRKLERESTGWQSTRSILRVFARFLILGSPVLYLIARAALNIRTPEERRQFIEIGALLLVSLAAAFAPLYSAPQYLAPPVFLLAVYLALSIRIVMAHAKPSRRKSGAFILIFGLIWIVPFWALTLPASIKAFAQRQPAPLQIQEMSRRISQIAASNLRGTSCPMSALSLSAVPLLGTPFEIAPFSATGPFMPIISDELRRHAPFFAHYASVSGELRRTSPTALLVGYFPEMRAEQALVAYARALDYRAFNLGILPGYLREMPYLEMNLLIRRDCMSPSDQTTVAPRAMP